MTPEQLAALLAAIGAGTLLTETVRALWKWIGGKANRERDVVAAERKRADEAEEKERAAFRDLDVEARRRRKSQEYAAKLRRIAIEHGIPPSDLPAWPTELLD